MCPLYVCRAFSISTVDLVISLTSAVGVYHETLVDVVLYEQKSLLKDLPGTRLLHCVGVTWVPEKSKQLSWGTRLTGGTRDGGMEGWGVRGGGREGESDEGEQ